MSKTRNQAQIGYKVVTLYNKDTSFLNSAMITILGLEKPAMIGNVRVGQNFEFVESIGAQLTSFSQPALLMRGYK
jgi:hypothetical protein